MGKFACSPVFLYESVSRINHVEGRRGVETSLAKTANLLRLDQMGRPRIARVEPGAYERIWRVYWDAGRVGTRSTDRGVGMNNLI